MIETSAIKCFSGKTGVINYPSTSGSLLQIKNHYRVLLVMCFLTSRWMYIYIYIIYSIYFHLLLKKTVYF